MPHYLIASVGCMYKLGMVSIPAVSPPLTETQDVDHVILEDTPILQSLFLEGWGSCC